MIEESEKMVIDTATRLGKAADVLGDLVVRARTIAFTICHSHDSGACREGI